MFLFFLQVKSETSDLGCGIFFILVFAAFTASKSGALEFARSSGFLSSKSLVGDGWTITVPLVSDLQREASGRLSAFKQKLFFEEGFNSFDVKSLFPAHSMPIWPSFGEFNKQLFRGNKGMSVI